MSVRQPNEDLFDDSRMSFGEHLEELRLVLVRSLYGLVVACAIGFYFANDVVQFLQTPLKAAIGDFKIDRAKEKLREQNGGYLPPELMSKMQTERMIPRVYQIDPAQIVRILRLTSENHMSDVDLTPYRFLEEEIQPQKVGELASLWLEGKQTQRSATVSNDRTSFLKSMLNESQQSRLQGLSNLETASPDEVAVLLEVLNEIIEQPAIHQSEAFAEQVVKPDKPFYAFWKETADDTFFQMKQAVDEDSGDIDLSRRLNHLLLSQVFEEQLNKPQIPMTQLQLWEPAEVNPQSLAAPEVFMIWLKAGLFTGLFIGSPWLFFQIWNFVAAGLYNHEQRYVYIYLPFSLILFFSGAALSFFFVFKPVLSFLFQFNAQMGIEPQPRIGDWLSFVMFLPLGFGIAFQLPLVMLALNRIGLIEMKSYIDKWRVAVLVIFVVSMFLTPADPISLIMLAIPLSLLYFLGISMCRWMPRGRNPFGEVVEEP